MKGNYNIFLCGLYTLYSVYARIGTWTHDAVPIKHYNIQCECNVFVHMCVGFFFVNHITHIRENDNYIMSITIVWHWTFFLNQCFLVRLVKKTLYYIHTYNMYIPKSHQASEVAVTAPRTPTNPKIIILQYTHFIDYK